MRALRAFAAALAVAAAGALPAAAQDAPPHPHGGAPAAANPLPEGVLRFRALDVSAMFEASHGGKHDAADVPLTNRTVRMLAPSGVTAEVTTDADGRLTFPSAGVNAGDVLEFLVPDPSGTDRWPLLIGTPVRAGTGQPGELSFVKVHDGPDPIRIGPFLQTVTVPDREEGTPSVRVNLFAGVRNTSDAVWIGKRGALDRGTFRFRVPTGFTLVAAQVSGNDAQADLEERPDGGSDVVIRERFYPTSFTGKDQMVRAVLTGPYDPDGLYDFSFTAAYPIDSYRLNLEKLVLHYEPSGDVELEDGGPNPPMSGRETHGWEASDIAVGKTVGVRVSAKARIDPKVWYTLGTLALIILGAVFLAKALSGREGPREPAPAGGPAPKPADDRTAKLAELDRKLRRGEITSFEHAARRRQVDDGPRPAVAPPSAPREPDVRTVVEEIAARADSADEATLRRDVKRLAGIARGLLG